MSPEPFGWIYDFERDRWVESRSLRRSWEGGELPPAPEAPGFGRWTAPSSAAKSGRPFKGREAALGLLLAGSGGALLTLATGLPVFLFALLAVPAGCALLRVRPSKSPTVDDARLIEILNDHDVCLVQVSIVQDGEPTGRDRGVVWFEGGRLLFNGHRCSFAIGGEDVQPRSRWLLSSRQGERVVKNPLALPLRVPAVAVHLEFEILHDGRELAKRRFIERLAAFRTYPPRSRGPRQWPPFGRE